MKPSVMTLDTIHPFQDDSSLLDGLLESPLKGAELGRIDGIENEFEAEMMRDALDKEGIPCLVQSYRETPFSGIFLAQKSWGSIILRMDDAERALEILNRVRESVGFPAADHPAELEPEPES